MIDVSYLSLVIIADAVAIYVRMAESGKKWVTVYTSLLLM